MATRHEYPKWKYHKEKPAVIVHNPDEEEALGDEWADRPDLVQPPADSAAGASTGRPETAAPDETPAGENDAGETKQPKKRK